MGNYGNIRLDGITVRELNERGIYRRINIYGTYLCKNKLFVCWEPASIRVEDDNSITAIDGNNRLQKIE